MVQVAQSRNIGLSLLTQFHKEQLWLIILLDSQSILEPTKIMKTLLACKQRYSSPLRVFWNSEWQFWGNYLVCLESYRNWKQKYIESWRRRVGDILQELRKSRASNLFYPTYNFFWIQIKMANNPFLKSFTNPQYPYQAENYDQHQLIHAQILNHKTYFNNASEM